MSAVELDAAAVAELASIDAAIVAAYDALHTANGRGLTGADAAAMVDAMRDVDERCAALRRRVWPRYRGRLVVALGDAVLVSPSGRSTRLVWTHVR